MSLEPSAAKREGHSPMDPTYFTSPAEFRAWLQKHHANAKECLVCFYKRGSGKSSMTWPESVDVALCFGWIDGVRKSIDATAYTIRFTPRKARSTWSAVNIRHMQELTALGLVQPAGHEAFARRSEARSGIYSYENRSLAEFTSAQERQLKANREAWKFFQAQAPWYRKTATWWVISAKKDETRQRRLNTLIRHSENSETLPHLTQKPKAAG
jgi:uncharacterized protein YdeI (YjbR/CyaY-like superfamily)